MYSLGNSDLSFNDDLFNLALNDLQDKVISLTSPHPPHNCQSPIDAIFNVTGVVKKPAQNPEAMYN